MREYLSINEAADLLGVTDRSIRNWIADGSLAAYRVGKKIVRIRRADIEHKLMHRIQSADPESNK